MIMQEWILFSNFSNWWWWSSATLVLASWWWWWSGVWSLESGPELANCSQARRLLIMPHMCVWLAGWLGWLADWLTSFFCLIFFLLLLLLRLQSISFSSKTQNPAKNQHKFRTFFFKKNFTRRGEKEIATVVLGVQVQARNYEKTFVYRQTNGDGASVRTGQEWSLQPKWRWSHNQDLARFG